ncbi:WRKY transcription factor 55 [Lycium ferocissimum]|uniref:WRKY transcription factor 55 n=1 Tax=Lycium ferocissimum TaxID=112874 RepID=UPI0028163EA6|nr:WRKY transcription factor 55 [Lycium ferocissimum]
MDETTAIILYGCKLGKELEANLPNWANQRGVILNKTEEILAVFNNVKERLMSHHQHQQQVVQEWLSSSAATTQALELFHAAENMPAFAGHGLPPESDQMGLQHQVAGQNQVMDASHDSNRAARSSSSQRQRRRTGDTDRRTVRMAAPRMGNLELPPEDGYTWRKYGQKEILGSRFPRAYYRCTYQKLYNCPAKKQVQRLDNDPYVFEVTYRSQHTCSVPPQSVEEITHQTTTTPPPAPLLLPPPTSASLSEHWLSMDIKPQGEAGPSATSTSFDIQRDFGHGTGGSLASICNVVNTGSGGAGPSGGRYGREIDHYQPVVDMADAMFNSGSSSNTSMDIIFPSIDEKWDTADKKE